MNSEFPDEQRFSEGNASIFRRKCLHNPFLHVII